MYTCARRRARRIFDNLTAVHKINGYKVLHTGAMHTHFNQWCTFGGGVKSPKSKVPIMCV